MYLPKAAISSAGHLRGEHLGSQKHEQEFVRWVWRPVPSRSLGDVGPHGRYTSLHELFRFRYQDLDSLDEGSVATGRGEGSQVVHA